MQNLFYQAAEDFYVCPMGQRMSKVGASKRVSSNGYVAQVTYYQAVRCEGCPLRGLCHKAAGNRKIAVNHRLNALRSKARNLLTSEAGIAQGKKRPAEVEAVFGQLKSNNKFNRFTFKGLAKVELASLLMATGHNLRKMVAKRAKTLVFYFLYLKKGIRQAIELKFSLSSKNKELWLIKS